MYRLVACVGGGCTVSYKLCMYLYCDAEQDVSQLGIYEL